MNELDAVVSQMLDAEASKFEAEAETHVNQLGPLSIEEREKAKANHITQLRNETRRMFERVKRRAIAFSNEYQKLLYKKRLLKSVFHVYKAGFPLSPLHRELLEEKSDLFEMQKLLMDEYNTMRLDGATGANKRVKRIKRDIKVIKIRVGEIDARLPGRFLQLSLHRAYVDQKCNELNDGSFRLEERAKTRQREAQDEEL